MVRRHFLCRNAYLNLSGTWDGFWYLFLAFLKLAPRAAVLGVYSAFFMLGVFMSWSRKGPRNERTRLMQPVQKVAKAFGARGQFWLRFFGVDIRPDIAPTEAAWRAAFYGSTLGDFRPGHKNPGRFSQGCARQLRCGKVAKTVKSQCPLCVGLRHEKRDTPVIGRTSRDDSLFLLGAACFFRPSVTCHGEKRFCSCRKCCENAPKHIG